jgi:FxsC-like protein
VTAAPGTLAPYFYLSYARSDPLAGDPAKAPDELVEIFFNDLTSAVQSRASAGRRFVPGFFDRGIPVGSDWKQFITQQLSTAQVFVPLYSVGYLTNSWPGREFACFWERVVQAQGNPVHRLVPVLWAPLVGFAGPPGLNEALASGSTDPDYADTGLRAMLKLGYDSYWEVVNRLAAQIVELAERDPIEAVEPSKVPDIEKVESAFPAAGPLPVFTIEVAAPTAPRAARSRDPQIYGATRTQWRPFPEQELPLGEYARQVTKRFDFDARVGDVSVPGDPAQRRPGIIVIDPAFIADKAGRDLLRAVVNELPRWVMPLVVVEPDDERTNQLAAEVFDILTKAKALPTMSARHGASGVKSLDEFVAIIPRLVAEAERQYLRYRSSRPSPRPVGRRRLNRPDGPDGPAAASDS